MSVFFCPRCGEHTYERLRTHSYCQECNYSPDLDEDWPKPIPTWVYSAVPRIIPNVNDRPFSNAIL
jgi:hypothetical protein